MKYFSILFPPLLLVLFLAACSDSDPAPLATTPPPDPYLGLIEVSASQFEGQGMELGQLTERNLPTTVPARGTIDVPPDFRAEVTPYYQGFVTEIRVLPGQKVRRGEVLFTLQNPDYIALQQEYLEAKGQMAFLKDDFERQKILAEENIASEKGKMKAASDYEVMRATYLGLREQLQLMQIPLEKLEAGEFTHTLAVRAPIGGSITEVDIAKGSFVDREHRAVGIINLEHIHLELNLFEKDALAVREGQALTFTLAERGSGTFRGEVHLVGTEIDPENRTINVHGHIAEAEGFRFLPGMFVEAEITTAEQPARCLPKDAVVETESGDQVLVLVRKEEGRYYFKSVAAERGGESRDWVEVKLSADAPQGKILTKGAFQVL